jgi:thioesterase domain-containing protein
MVHPVGGEVQSYRRLARAIGSGPTICVIADPRQRHSDLTEISVAQRAARYSKELAQSIGDDSDLSLGGWSFGG